MSFVRLPVTPLVTDKEVRDLYRRFDTIKDRTDLEAARQRLKHNAFWHAVGLIEDQEVSFVKPLDYDDLPV